MKSALRILLIPIWCVILLWGIITVRVEMVNDTVYGLRWLIKGNNCNEEKETA